MKPNPRTFQRHAVPFMRLLPPPPPRPLLRERLRPPPPPPRLRERLRRPPPERERLRFPPPPPLERERLRERDFLRGTAGSVTCMHQRARPHIKRKCKRWPRKHAHSNPSRPYLVSFLPGEASRRGEASRPRESSRLSAGLLSGSADMLLGLGSCYGRAQRTNTPTIPSIPPSSWDGLGSNFFSFV